MTTQEWIDVDEWLYATAGWRLWDCNEQIDFGVSLDVGRGELIGGRVMRDLVLKIAGPLEESTPFDALGGRLALFGYVLREPFACGVEHVGIHAWQTATMRAQGIKRP